MDKMSIAEAAEFFGVSKEAIHNRIRRGSLVSEVEDGQKYVMVDSDSQATTKPSKKTTTNRSNNTHTDSKYYKLLEEQNSQLQNKVEKLETETRTLRDQKEQMLIEERIKIENIYKEKDEQLKNIINMISSNLMLETKPTIETAESVEAEIEAEEWISLNKFLKSRDVKKSKRKKIIKDFVKKAEKGDESILLKDKKCYIDINRFEYDL
ncbi:DNA-binding protein [Sulfurimonas lithotrophica]|uniref:DNA-binding protein n=1 Tax=Sulfurimonas lithotrophica TaxID=2590022 RepID=A0A5P8P3N4_9BACT|nr:DNA-binding protein [Sulfurimonas lithotrophica]QFR50342.1 DNA-binding protein [Sulfurimonas lithotrophica]